MNIQAFMTLLLSIVCSCMQAQVFDANVVLDFEHVSNNKAIIKNDSTLKVAPDERYLVSKLKYYISQICFKGEKVFIDPTPYLIEDGRNQQIRLTIPSGRYERLAFMLGLDSLLHCSGAQSGDLDPLNDMFWTWNNGYVIFKLEGKYFSSGGRSGKLEHHLGGYREDQKISQAIELKFPEPLILAKGENKKIKVILDLDKYWSGKEVVSPVHEPVITKPGKNAVRISGNFSEMFYLKDKP